MNHIVESTVDGKVIILPATNRGRVRMSFPSKFAALAFFTNQYILSENQDDKDIVDAIEALPWIP